MALTSFSDVLADQRASELVSQDYIDLAADRNALQNHQALYFAGDFGRTNAGASTGSVRKVPILGLHGYDIPAAVAEGASIVPSSVTDQQFTISVARGGKAYQATDEVKFTDALGVFNTQAMALEMVQSHGMRLMNSVASLVGGFTNNINNTGVAMSVAHLLAAIALIETGSQRPIMPGECMGIIHTVNHAQLRNSYATSTAGAVQWLVDPEMLRIRGNGFIGDRFGVDLFASGLVPTANAGVDRAGGLFVRGGIAWAQMTPVVDGPEQAVLGGPIPGGGIALPVLFERDRNAPAGITGWYGASWLGATRGYDTSPHLMGCSLINSAT